jgi:heat shock protein HslJ
MRKFLLFLIFFSAMPAFSAVYLKVLYIADSSVTCGMNTCLLTRDSPAENYRIFNKTIEGFTFQEGFEYCLLIEIQTPGITEPAQPFDSSQVKYVLKEIKSKIKTTAVLTKSVLNIPDSSKWILYKLKMKTETRTFSITKAFMQFDTKNNTVSGSTDCNGFFGNYSNDSVFKFLNISSTLLACKRSVETEFLSALNSTNRIKITSKLLYLYRDKKLLALFTRKK